MVLKNFLSNFGKNSERFKELETESKMHRLLEQKQKNSNERELERFLEEERQKNIKKQLQYFREKQKAEMRGNIFAKQDNFFKGHKNILTNDMPVLKERQLFMVKGNMI